MIWLEWQGPRRARVIRGGQDSGWRVRRQGSWCYRLAGPGGQEEGRTYASIFKTFIALHRVLEPESLNTLLRKCPEKERAKLLRGAGGPSGPGSSSPGVYRSDTLGSPCGGRRGSFPPGPPVGPGYTPDRIEKKEKKPNNS